MTVLEPYRQFADARGRMLGVINEGQWEEINFVETAAGQVRGGHFHRETRELFLIISGEIRVRIVDQGRDSLHDFGPGSVFVIEPGESHWFESLTPCTWINVLSRRIDPACPDIVPVAAPAA
jgi:mannose-6-phosphate isomerase-like protein (cupin superfamily)